FSAATRSIAAEYYMRNMAVNSSAGQVSKPLTAKGAKGKTKDTKNSTAYFGLSEGAICTWIAWTLSDLAVSTDTTPKLPLALRTWIVRVDCVPKGPERTLSVVRVVTRKPAPGSPGFGSSTCCTLLCWPPDATGCVVV